ncbi:MAG: PAS domain-containing protein [Treponemataceae bacterium]|nr:PAS domain-containing protein [Treponemataceae bacterium]
MNFLYPIYTEQTECQDCYKCVRQCPCKAIRVENGHAMVVPQLCVLCGSCVINCPAHAKHIRDDLSRTKQLLNVKPKVIASLAPSFASEFDDYPVEVVIAALKGLGFYGVSETALGADLVSSETASMLKRSACGEMEQKLFLSSACPAAVEYIKQQFPEYAPYIADTASPLMAHARFLKKLYGDDIGVVFIGPCIAKKRESDVFNEIDTAITFTDLRRWMEQLEDQDAKPELKPSRLRKQLAAGNLQADFIPRRAAKSALYPVDGGMGQAVRMYANLDDVTMMNFSGINRIGPVLCDLNPAEVKEPVFVEFLSCPGGCVNGPCSTRLGSTAVKNISVYKYAATADRTITTDLLLQKPDLTGTLPVEPVTEVKYSEEEIRSALRSVGKYTREDELNCACCGYDTCRSFACAMLDKHAEKTMCVSYMRKLAQKKANALMRSIPSGVVIADKDLNIVDCNRNFATLMGPDVEEMFEALPGLEGADLRKISDMARFFTDVISVNGPDVIEREFRNGKKIYHVTVFAIEKNECAGGVVEDITAPQVQRNRIITQAKKVIDKNLSVVQKIAFLLGENAAETESILNSIIESFAGDDEDTNG